MSLKTGKLHSKTSFHQRSMATATKHDIKTENAFDVFVNYESLGDQSRANFTKINNGNANISFARLPQKERGKIIGIEIFHLDSSMTLSFSCGAKN